MKNFICKNCNYRFESGFERAGKTCPYCGEKKVAEESNAEEILNDVE